MIRSASSGWLLVLLCGCSETHSFPTVCESDLQLERPFGETVEIVEAESVPWTEFKILIASSVISESTPFTQARSVVDSEDGFVQFKPGEHFLVKSRSVGGSEGSFAFENACSVQDGQCSCFELRRGPVDALP